MSGFGGADVADTAAASFWRDAPAEIEPLDTRFLLNRFRETLALAAVRLPKNIEEMRAIFLLIFQEAVRSAREDGYDANDADELDHSEADCVVELLQRFTHVENGRLYAHCYLLVINRSPYTEVQIARLLKIEKQAVSKVKTALQDQLGLKPRVGRSAASRQKFRNLCLARARQKYERPGRPIIWPGAALFRQAFT